MTTSRCPMCGKQNEGEAEVCEFCGARIRPLVLDPSDHDLPSEGLSPEEEEPVEEKPVPDWLARIRSQSPEELDEEPHAEEEAKDEDDEEKDWLERLREVNGLLPVADDPSEPESDDIPEAKPTTPWTTAGPGTPETETQASIEPEEGEPDETPVEELRREAEKIGPDETPVEELTREVEGIEPDEASLEELTPETEELDSTTSSFADLRREAEEAEGDSPLFVEPTPDEPRDQLEEEPQAGIEEDELPHVPALILDESEVDEIQEPEEGLEPVEIPEWMGGLDEDAPVQAEAIAEEFDLAPADLPPWLAAMRPIESVRPKVDAEPEVGFSIETAGPLAGLRGALMAEPVMAAPRSPTIAGTRLEVSERQFAQVEILERMLEDERRELPVSKRDKSSSPILRWTVGLLMIVAVTIPAIFNVPDFAAPTRWPTELEPLITMIEDLPTERPVLIVFDYEAGFAGELEAVAHPFLEHLLLRGLDVATMSTSPTGPMLSEHLFDDLRRDYPAEVERQYINMGYLPGGSTAVRLFASSPRETILSGFVLPENFAGASIWDLPSLDVVDSLSDFGMLALITAGTDNARNWAEQVSGRLGESPLVMITSAGTGPVVRPYYEGGQSQVDGLLSGLPAAVSYELALGRSGVASARWSAFGTGSWVAFLVLALAALYGLILRVAQTRPEDDLDD